MSRSRVGTYKLTNYALQIPTNIGCEHEEMRTKDPNKRMHCILHLEIRAHMLAITCEDQRIREVREGSLEYCLLSKVTSLSNSFSILGGMCDLGARTLRPQTCSWTEKERILLYSLTKRHVICN